ncbi:MAG TPA: uroporphyrinogen decarboxylase family protein [Candidatus Hydrogenedentes bacterium]|jgi:uroporphyrinogen decarboxylase|nr:MAG: methylcobalamin:coenzyme M methyltransferase [Candidatus Hydrogenedentes bacterium ADurb.Bin170]HOD94702.1 uroporphyrinogen decarboxylase family protein [Candidatus Hydrogenedentota bacterium]HOR50173.1 uroporphyrinogen decarboxylase family protein [Candidatus Hydrogenedentota bacterium]HPK24484.1 uroporphyrinogen decarboxylase family protein [Candidatus Hydrogenedentota bacterium]HPX85574.1 uroporphyrinogen decarboxylase family protein [Candidatus Hydrogenedentota bacterium]
MRDKQWNDLLAVLDGKRVSPLPVGFIIDSPWLPAWHGVSVMDYFADPHIWLEANLNACSTFPDIWFLPGFWSEFGMCSEPAALGARCSFYPAELPYAHPLPDVVKQFPDRPDPKSDGLTPFLLHRLCSMRSKIESHGYTIRFAIARGPLNIASFLMGISEFLMALRLEPDSVHQLLQKINTYLLEWLRLQKNRIDSIDGIFILDDIVGFLGEPDYQEFAHPYLKELFNAFPASVRFFHNDAEGLVCASHLPDLNVNLFNFSHNHSIEQIRALAGNTVTLLGNLPPRDVLAQASAEKVYQETDKLARALDDPRRVIFSCGGGMPPGVPTENILAFLKAVQSV